jgi:LPS-assembly lipoprotein
MWLSNPAPVLMRLVVVSIALLVASCGFRLQGVGEYPESMAQTYISAQDQYSPFYRDLRVALQQGGVNLVGSPLDADAVIRIERDYSGKKVLTVSTDNRPTEYDVFYTISYSVWMKGQEVLPSRTLTLTQDYTYDETLVLGKNREEEIFLKAISSDLVRQVSQELSRLP